MKQIKIDRFKALNRGWSLGLFTPAEASSILREKLQSLAQENPNRFEPMLKGYDLARLERTKCKQIELQKRRANSKSKGRGR